MPPYCISRPRLGDITVVVELGVDDGTGQYAKERWVKVGTRFEKAKNFGQDTSGDGCERDR